MELTDDSVLYGSLTTSTGTAHEELGQDNPLGST